MSLDLFFNVPKEKEDEDLNDYLMHCYLYYELNTPVIYDYDFDKLCKDLLEKWDSINHSYKELISKSDLKAGTGYSIKEYPKEIIEEAESRKKIFFQELEHEVEVAREYEDRDFEFNGNPTETYLLCGMYVDYNHWKDQKNIKRQEEVNTELKNRIKEDNHKAEIERYISDHRITLKELNLLD